MHYIFYPFIHWHNKKSIYRAGKFFANYAPGKGIICRLYKKINLKESKEKLERKTYINQSEAELIGEE